jgi:TPR repeat protein
MRLSRFVPAFLIVASLSDVAWPQSPRPIVGGSSGQFSSAESAGLFVGVNRFDDKSLRWLACAVDDAVDQAYLFSLELGLIEPDKVTLALSGNPAKPETIQRLDELRAKGARITSATKSSIESNASTVAKSGGGNGLLVFAVSSHGYLNRRGHDFIVASDSVINESRISDTCVEVNWLLYGKEVESPAPRRLAFIDACRSRNMQARNIWGARIVSGNRWIGRGAVSRRVGQGLLQCQGAAVFSAAAAGNLSYEADGNGVFTGALLTALRGGGAEVAGSDGLLSVAELAEHMNATVNQWAADNKLAAAGIETRFTGVAYRLPLAETITTVSPLMPEPTRRPEAASDPKELFDRGVEAHKRGDYVEAVRLYRVAADLGNAPAMSNLGVMYGKGEGGLRQNDTEAVRWFRAAVELGDARAMSNLGNMYADGYGVRENDAEAVRLWRAAADLGDAAAICNLGIMYEWGQGGLPQDDAQAVRLYRAAADKGDANAMLLLGARYDDGRGVSQDLAKAVRLYRAAADQGDTIAMSNLGVMYADGRGVRQDAAEAVHWFRAAADQGEAKATFNLGVMYEDGRGVYKSEKEAIKWYKRAARLGDKEAQETLRIRGQSW